MDHANFSSRSATRPPSARSLGLVSLLGASLLAGPAIAAEYSWEISAIYGTTETGPQIDADSFGVAATWYFSPVDDSRGPSALAAFLSRSSSLGIGGFDHDERRIVPLGLQGAPPILTLHDGLDGFSVTGKYVWRQSGWYLGGGFDSADGEQGGGSLSPNFSDVRGYRATVGKYLRESTSLELTMATAETDVEQGTFACSIFFACVTGVETQADDVALRALHVGKLGRMTYSLEGGAATTDVDIELRTTAPLLPPPPFPPAGGPVFLGGGVVFEAAPPSSIPSIPLADFQAYSLAGELFPTPRLGVRVGYVHWHDNPQQDEGYDVAATWFFVPRIAARLSLAHITHSRFFSEIPDSRSAALEILGRF